MGKINEYQRKQLASSAVGVAAPDKSGEIIGGAVSKFGMAMKAHAQKMDEYNTIQANSALIPFGLLFQETAVQIRREVAGNPSLYGEKLLEYGTTLIDNSASSIEDPGVRDKFVAGAQTMLKAALVQAPKWSESKKKENATIAAEKAMDIVATGISRSRSKEELLANLQTGHEFYMNEITDDITSLAEREKAWEKNAPLAMNAYLAANVLERPKEMVNELAPDSTMMDGVPFFTNKMKVKYYKEAEARVKAQEKYIREAKEANYQTLLTKYNEKTLTFSEIIEKAMARDPVEQISAGKYNNLLNFMMERSEENAEILTEDVPAANKYVDLIYDVFDNRKERAIALETVGKLMAGGITTRDENTFFLQMGSAMKDVKASKMANNIFKSAQILANRIDKMYSHPDEKATKTALAFRELISGTMKGIAPNVVAQSVLRMEDVKKVLGLNPALAHYDDPVEASYRLETIQFLQAHGMPVVKANIDTGIEQLKAENDK